MIGSVGSLLRSCFRDAVRIREGAGALVLFLILCRGLIDPVACAGDFLSSLWLPACWALATISLLASVRGVLRGVGFVALFFPVAATHIHYAVALASHRSFLFAGIFPWGDAYMHFRQAAQMAQDGFATRPFNGRFLYPGFFSSLLRLCSFNMQIAHLAVGAIFTCGLYASVRALLVRTGVAGGSLFTLLLWIYWRDHGACLMMTEQLGVIFGILALPLLLSMTRRRSFALLLGANFLLAVGFSTRPGALFVLPMLVLFAGWAGWSGWIFPAVPALPRVMVSMLIAAVVSGAGLFSNHVIQTTAFRGTVVPYGNFAYTLNGLLNATTWEDSYTRYRGNPSLVMEENKALLREHPALLAKGVFRAYVRAVSIKFLYSFDSENRLAAISWLFAITALVSLWRDSARRDDALWITLFGIGVLLSIPFAPPWDAGIRPYAVTIPFQAYLAASGLGICVRSLLKWLKVDDGSDRSPMPTPTPMVVPASLLALLVLSLTFVLPVIHARGAADLATSAPAVPGIRFIPGSSVMLDVGSAGLMQSGLSSIASCFRGEVKALDLLRPGCLIGINWNDLGRYAALPDATAFKDYGRITTDVRLLPR
jgi:hypothetical protein